MKQHKGDHKSKVNHDNNTAAFQNSKSTGHTYDLDNTQILKSGRNLQKKILIIIIIKHQHSRPLNQI